MLPPYPVLLFGVGWSALLYSFRLVSRMVSSIVSRMASKSEALNRELFMFKPSGDHFEIMLGSFWCPFLFKFNKMGALDVQKLRAVGPKLGCSNFGGPRHPFYAIVVEKGANMTPTCVQNCPRRPKH